MSEGPAASYDSIAQAAAGMGTTVGRLRWAKKKGAPGFRGSRVYPGELAPWLEGQEQSHSADGTPIDKEGWEIRKLRLQCESIELGNDEARGRYWNAQDVKASWLMHMRQARQVLISMATDLAPRIAGRPALECEKLLAGVAGEALSKLRGNPYGDVGECKCPECGKNFGDRLLMSGSRAKGKEDECKVVVGDQSEAVGAAEKGPVPVAAGGKKKSHKKGVGRDKGKGRAV